MRYFFHILGDGRTYEDEEGTVLSGPQAARRQAAILAAELARDRDHYRGFMIYVVNGDGKELVRLPVVTGIKEVP